MSLMIVSSESPESRMVVAKSRWSSVSGVSSSRPLMPMTAFIGVRISWLIVARKALLASLAASACARASCVSLNIFAFWIAITAWSAKDSTNAISRAVNGPHWRCANDRTMKSPPAARSRSIMGATTTAKLPTRPANRRTGSGTSAPFKASA